MEKTDLKKEMKQLFKAGKEPSFVTVPEMRFVAYDGQGDPNTSEEYWKSMEVLFGMAYTIKFMCKAVDKDFVVMPLEGQWWTDDLSDFSMDNKDIWKWTMMIALPDYVNNKMFEEASVKLAAKKDLPNLGKSYFTTYEEGLCAQILHTGPYNDEPPTIKKLHKFIEENAYKLHLKHKEVYLNSPLRTASEKLRTIIRQPVCK